MVNSNNSDDVSFRGIDLATIIRKKYGRSYDVQFIKKVSTPTLWTCNCEVRVDGFLSRTDNIYSEDLTNTHSLFIAQEFMGRQLLAMNVMWKYREQVMNILVNGVPSIRLLQVAGL